MKSKLALTKQARSRHMDLVLKVGLRIPFMIFNQYFVLVGGVVDMPALFTVDTFGETGALGFSIEGPSQVSQFMN